MSSVIIVFNTEDGSSFVHSSSIETFKKTHPEVEEFTTVDEKFFYSLNSKYLSAYTLIGKSLSLNIEKAREIRKEELRKKRSEYMKDLDVKFLIALEKGDEESKATVIEEKERLRNITTLVDSANTIEELEKIKIKNLENITCTIEDMRAAGFCVDGAKKWFESMGWDFRDFVKNGRSSSDYLNIVGDKNEMVMQVIEAAYKRTHK